MEPNAETNPNPQGENQRSNSRITICKQYEFEASHKLPNHEGQCARLHGHSYKLEVEVEGPVRTYDVDASDYGMVVDFSELSKIVKEAIIEPWDHRFLCAVTQNSPVPANETAFLNIPRTTAEFMVALAVARIQGHMDVELGKGIFVVRARLNETRTGWAEWRR